mmetsp:Transcript_48718/g.62538  ORF Transcript_48718/g.62538 Transcript_48718/m.62538 type:complete len:100 (+) Transcript_48718:191-490(+)
MSCLLLYLLYNSYIFDLSKNGTFGVVKAASLEVVTKSDIGSIVPSSSPSTSGNVVGGGGGSSGSGGSSFSISIRISCNNRLLSTSFIPCISCLMICLIC